MWQMDVMNSANGDKEGNRNSKFSVSWIVLLLFLWNRVQVKRSTDTHMYLLWVFLWAHFKVKLNNNEIAINIKMPNMLCVWGGFYVFCFVFAFFLFFFSLFFSVVERIDLVVACHSMFCAFPCKMWLNYYDFALNARNTIHWPPQSRLNFIMNGFFACEWYVRCFIFIYSVFGASCGCVKP